MSCILGVDRSDVLQLDFVRLGWTPTSRHFARRRRVNQGDLKLEGET